MNEHKQPEALRLADIFDDEIKWQTTPISRTEVAAELRRLHSEVEQLRESLLDLYYQNSISERSEVEQLRESLLDIYYQNSMNA